MSVPKYPWYAHRCICWKLFGKNYLLYIGTSHWWQKLHRQDSGNVRQLHIQRVSIGFQCCTCQQIHRWHIPAIPLPHQSSSHRTGCAGWQHYCLAPRYAVPAGHSHTVCSAGCIHKWNVSKNWFVTINFRYCHTHILHQLQCCRKSLPAGSPHRSCRLSCRRRWSWWHGCR